MLKNRTSIPASLAPFFVALMLMMVSCGKEECIAPASAETSGTVKGLSTPSTDTGGGTFAESNSRDDDRPPVVTGETDGIGDDGDDISDTERNRKKR